MVHLRRWYARHGPQVPLAPAATERRGSVDTARLAAYPPAVTHQPIDLFKDKARDFDTHAVPTQISAGVGAALRARVALTADMRVMDFGAGTGLVCAHVAPHVATVYAVDISEAMLAQLAAKPELRGKVEIRCQDILERPLDHPVDLIISAMAMHHVADTDRMLRAFAAHLVPGGRLALADLDVEPSTFHPHDAVGVFHHGFDRADLGRRLAGAGFTAIEFATATQVVKDDRRYDVFLVTATKA
ncbi:MAG: methyltransferase domain-containing protein [Myxococcales bacterium]|nr:methyltransferase domain-containing protein [Myxococcales bacterium]MBK7191322.1 methyltransferase domain-containing protein [Myxococcales bacterium]